MIKELSTEKIFGLVRPLYQHGYDRFRIPIMDKITEEMLDFHNVQPLNVQNLFVKNNNTRKLKILFNLKNFVLFKRYCSMYRRFLKGGNCNGQQEFI